MVISWIKKTVRNANNSAVYPFRQAVLACSRNAVVHVKCGKAMLQT